MMKVNYPYLKLSLNLNLKLSLNLNLKLSLNPNLKLSLDPNLLSVEEVDYVSTLLKQIPRISQFTYRTRRTMINLQILISLQNHARKRLRDYLRKEFSN